MLNRKTGQLTIFMMLLLVGLFIGLVLLLVGGVMVIKMDDALAIDLDLGQVNMEDSYANTFGKFTEMYKVSADWWGISLIFGMVMGLFLSAYFTRNSFPKWGIIIDIFIIIGIFIASLYVSASYSTTLDALASAGETFLEDYATRTSKFMINLPIYVVIIGVVMMILFHASIPRRSEERIQQGGFLRGVQ